MPKTRIKVFAEQGEKQILYRLESANKCGDVLRFDGSDWDLKFEIQPNTLGLRFKPTPTDAFWASTSTCPHQASQVEALKPKKVDEDGQILIVKNKNAEMEYLHFSLNFEGEDNGRPRRYDPVIENRNAHFDDARDFNLGAIVGAAFLGAAAIAGLAYKLRAKDRRR